MKISLNWLKQFVDIPAPITPKKLGELITIHTAEVEEVADLAASYDNIVMGQVISLKKHPNADKLTLVQVDIGQQTPVQVVCGGKNLKEKMKVAVALPGAWVKWHGEGEPVQLTETKIRGEASFGMICAGEEIGLENDNPPGSTEVHIHDLSALPAKPGTPLAKALNKNDAIFDIDNKSLTHRPDLWGHYGMAREVAAILKRPLKPLSHFTTAPIDLKKTPAKKFAVQIKDEKGCPNFDACVLENVRVMESPQWMKSRLQGVGLRPINNIVDVTNYVMLELGQPMHAYDRKIVGGYGLTVRHAKKGEKLETIDHKKRPLHEDDLIIASPKGEPLGLAGVMGGAKSEIQPNTTEIILEAATFDPIIVRKMSTRHNLRSDASQRFEKGLDSTLTPVAIRRAIQLLKETCPNAECITPLTGLTIGGEKPIKITLNPRDVVNKIGVDLTVGEMIRLLEALEFKVKKSGKELTVTVPPHRATGDVDIEDDLIEEIARLYGYNKIPSKLPELPIHLPQENPGNTSRADKHAARIILAKALGLNEVMNYSFYNAALFKRCGQGEMNHIKVLNYLSEDQTHMRVSLIPGLLQSIEKNSHERDDLRLFEFGRTYKEIGEFMPLEEKHLALAVARLPKNQKPYEPFYEIKGLVEAFFNEFRPQNVHFHHSTTPPPYAHPKKCVDILQDGKPIGWIFTLHPGVAQAFSLEHSVGLAEINFTKLVEKPRLLPKFKPLPKFPITTFDLSLLTDQKTEVATLEKTMRNAVASSSQVNIHGLIHAIELFDLYQGPGIPESKKSLAFHIQLSHPDHAISDQEFKEVQNEMIKALVKTGVEVRS